MRSADSEHRRSNFCGPQGICVRSASALRDEFVLALQLRECSVQLRQLLLHVSELLCLRDKLLLLLFQVADFCRLAPHFMKEPRRKFVIAHSIDLAIVIVDQTEFSLRVDHHAKASDPGIAVNTRDVR